VMGPRVSLSARTCVGMARVWARTRATVIKVLEERTAQNFVTRASGAQTASSTAHVRMAPRVTL